MSATIYDSSAPNNSDPAPINSSPGIVASSSATIIPFEPKAAAAPNFAQAREAWLARWHNDDRLTHADRTLCTQIARGFNRKHHDQTRALLSWPSWETMEAEGRISERSIRRGLKKLERLGAVQIMHGTRDPKTGWKLGNQYCALLPHPPGNLPGGHPAIWPEATRQDAGRLSERDSLILERRNSSSEGGTTAPVSPTPRSARPPFPAPRVKVKYETNAWRQLYKYGPEVLGKSFNRVQGHTWQMVDQADIDAVDAFLLKEAECLKKKPWRTPQVFEVTRKAS